METAKAHDRRVREGFFSRYITGLGIDIGPQQDPLMMGTHVTLWDRPNDAHNLRQLGGGRFNWVYSSHCLEHLEHPEKALREWWRVLAPQGHMIVVVPHRDLYEQRRILPPTWNGEHKMFFLPDMDEAPNTFGLLPMVRRALGGNPELVYLKVCDTGWMPSGKRPDGSPLPLTHPTGEYSIELVVKKPRGFTLIELLAVIVIIAVLLGILVPALAPGRVVSRETACKVNLNTIRQAIAVYGGGWCLPPAGLKILRPGTDAPNLPSLERFIDIGWSKVYFCPSTRGMEKHPDRSSYNFGPGGGFVLAGQTPDVRKTTIVLEHGVSQQGILGEAYPNHRGGVHVATSKTVTWILPPSEGYPLDEEE